MLQAVLGEKQGGKHSLSTSTLPSVIRRASCQVAALDYYVLGADHAALMESHSPGISATVILRNKYHSSHAIQHLLSAC
jgi:hypothetical protein